MTSRTSPQLLTANKHSSQFLVCLVAVVLALIVLLVGNLGADTRLIIAGIPLSSFFFLLAIVMTFLLPMLPTTRRTAILLLTPVLCLAVTLPISLDIEGGTLKLINLLATTFVAGTLLAGASQRLGAETVIRLFILVMAVLLVSALIYKIRYGFFDRQILFLFNGPIVFARLMGLACIFSLVVLKGSPRLLLSLMFYSAVLWTASKGPLLALTTTIAIYTLLFATLRQRLFLLLLSTSIATLVVINYEYLSAFSPLSRLFISFASGSSLSISNWDSIGSRLVLLRETIQIIENHPFGIGLGSWSAYTGITWAQYPHNFFLELWSEGGIVIGSIATLTYLAFITRPQDLWWPACLFLLLAQQVSGDLLDSRYLLTFSILGFLCRREGSRFNPSVNRELSE